MAKYVLARLLSSVLVFLAVTLLVFVAFFALPKNDFGRRGSHTGDQFRIHGSMAAAYRSYMWRIVRHGDFGASYLTHEPVTSRLFRAAPVTLSLVLGGVFVWLMIAVPLGLLAALRPRSLVDRAATVLVLMGFSSQPLWLGLLVSWFFGRYLHVLPPSGYCGIANVSTGCDGLGRWTLHLVLPWVTFGVVNAGIFMAMTRALVIEELEAEYVRTAHAKGATSLRIVRGHLLRNVTVPLLTMLGLTAGTSLVGVIFVESAFNLPGLGGLLRQATVRHDLPTVAGSVLFLAVVIMGINLAIDLAYGFIDPRIRAKGPVTA